MISILLVPCFNIMLAAFDMCVLGSAAISLLLIALDAGKSSIDRHL